MQDTAGDAVACIDQPAAPALWCPSNSFALLLLHAGSFAKAEAREEKQDGFLPTGGDEWDPAPWPHNTASWATGCWQVNSVTCSGRLLA